MNSEMRVCLLSQKVMYKALTTNRAFSLRGKEEGKKKKLQEEKKRKEIANTLVHHAVILYELSVHRALSRYSELYH